MHELRLSLYDTNRTPDRSCKVTYSRPAARCETEVYVAPWNAACAAAKGCGAKLRFLHPLFRGLGPRYGTAPHPEIRTSPRPEEDSPASRPRHPPVLALYGFAQTREQVARTPVPDAEEADAVVCLYRITEHGHAGAHFALYLHPSCSPRRSRPANPRVGRGACCTYPCGTVVHSRE